MKQKTQRILPKVAMAATLSLPLSPTMSFATPLREKILGLNSQTTATMSDPELILEEEQSLQLACLLTCGRSCSHTDNC
jgi:hypothetical protein